MLFDRSATWSRRSWYGAGILAFGAALAGALDLWRGSFGYDFAAYVLAARRLIDGLPLYPDEVVLGPFGQFLYPPVVAAMLIPALAAPRVAAAVWMLLLLGTTILLGWSLVRGHERADRPWVAAAFVSFPPLLWDLSLGNVTLAALCLALLAWHLRARPAAAGSLLAASLALKPLAAATLLVWTLTGRVRPVAWSILLALGVILITWPWLGQSWLDYARVLGAIATAAPGAVANIVPGALATGPARWLLPILAVCAATAGALAARRGSLPGDHAFRLALAVGPLLSTTVWYPYLLFALPLLLAPGPTGLPWPGWGLRSVRVLAWVIMLAQAVREPGRSFVLPLFGLLILILLGLLPVAASIRERASAEREPTEHADVSELAVEGGGRGV